MCENFSEHRAKCIFARAIDSLCKQFCEGAGEGKGDHPRETKRHVNFVYLMNFCMLWNLKMK